MKKLWLGTVKLDLLLLTSELPCGSKSEFLKQMKKTEHEAHSNFSLLLQVTHLNWQYAGIGRAYKLGIRIYSDFFKSINRSKKKNELQWDVWMNIFIIFIWLSFNAKNEKKKNIYIGDKSSFAPLFCSNSKTKCDIHGKSVQTRCCS